MEVLWIDRGSLHSASRMSEKAPYRGPGQKVVQAREEARVPKQKRPVVRVSSSKRGASAPVRAEGRTETARGEGGGRKPVGGAAPRVRPDGLRADAAALRREFEPESLAEFEESGGFRRGRGPRVSLVWVKNVVGFFLLPVAWVWTLTVFGALQRETVTNRFWSTEDFWFFCLGIVCWMVWFTGCIAAWGVPKPMRYYVLGHEATHAVWAWLSMGTVSGFRYGPEGGHILTDKPNFWVTLSPYFYPIYCVALFLLFGVASIFYDFRAPVPESWWVTPMQGVWAVFGVAWAFHLSFTVWMIRRGQSDLSMHGNFFSLVVIYTMNLVVLTLFLWLAAPGVGLGSLGKDLMRHTEYVCDVLWNFGVWVVDLWRHPRAG